MYILRPYYGDMNIVKLGSGFNTVTKGFKRHFEDILENPEEYDDEFVKQVNKFLNTSYEDLESIFEAYKELDEEYVVDQIY